MKSTVDEIRARFDADVERFSHLETGQTAMMDAVVLLDAVADAAGAVTPNAKTILDIGCGAGNFTLRVLQRLPNLDALLCDLSLPMLRRAENRVRAVTAGDVSVAQQDIRALDLPANYLDIVVAGSSLHHLREDAEWEAVFTKIYHGLRPGGSFWISDLVEHSFPAIQEMMWHRYGDYLTDLKSAEYRDTVFDYIWREDTPRPLVWQLNLLQRVGFAHIEVLHKNGPFAAFGAGKAKKSKAR